VTVPPPELSRILALERIGARWQTHKVAVSPEERAALARRFELIELPALAAEVRLRRARAGRYVEIDGTLQAAVVQPCVVTLEPVAAAIDEPFNLLLGPIGGAEPGEGRSAGAPDLIVDLDEPEPLDGDEIDIGELVAQQLSLALDPYPRAPGVPAAGEAPVGEAGGPPEDRAETPAQGPFAALAVRRKPI
jgi:uncharacterized metal-binding protein YceD (DUF177 family)